MTTLNWSWIYGFFSFAAGFVSLSLSIYLSPHWKNASARILMMLTAATAIWSLAYGMELISPDMALKLWWVKIEYLGAVWVGMLIFCFITTIATKKSQVTRTGYLMLSLVPLLAILLVLTNDHHHLMWHHAWLDLNGRAPTLAYLRGKGFWGYVGFSYLLIFMATVVLIRALISAKGIVRKQLFMLLVGMICPWMANILYLAGFDELKHLDLTPAAFAVSGIAFSWGLLKYQMLGLIPLAREMMIESMGDPVIALDMNDRILDLNRAAQDLFRIDRATRTYNGIRETVPVLYELVEQFRGPEPVEVETRFCVEDLSKQWNLRISPLLNKKEKQTGRLVILRDITDRKNAEAALKESERIHRVILEASPNPIVFYNESGEVTYLNPAFTRVFGWHLDELLGKRIDFVPEEKQKETKEALQKTIDHPEGNYDFITQRMTKTGDILDVSINSALYLAKDGSRKSLVVNFTDITKLKKTEHELRHTQDYIRSIINSMPSALIGLTAEGIVTQWNTEAERLTGIPVHEAKEKRLEKVFPRLFNHIFNGSQALEGKTVRKESKIEISTGGKTILTDITIYPILSDKAEGVVIRVDDISDRVRMEEMMMQSEKMLSVGGLAAGMAHEINNPLAGILQNIQVVRNRLEKDLPANIKAASECGVSLDALRAYMEKRNIFAMMDLVRASGCRAAQIVENMLTFSRKSDHRKFTYSLHDIMEATLELIENDYNTKKNYDFRSIEIIRQYQEATPPVSCEKTQIQQVFLNILKNGAEAMVEAGISSPRFIIRCSREDHHAVLEIEDNGPGIAHDIQKRIFEPFFTTKEVGVGTGLGLSVSYFIITENHTGILAVDSTPGKGTVFIIKLPL
ncbi:MAG: PAS domain S-box protein [Desulfobacteraceae bacterium]|nr:PAS domain S-box protein [Desulfobacteraceae bacterium]